MAPARVSAKQNGRQAARSTAVRAGAAGSARKGSGRGAALGGYFREVRTELRKVVWPSRREAANLTLVTLALATAVGLFLGGIDYVFQEFFRIVIQTLGGG